MKEVAGTKPKAHPKTDSKTDSTIDSTIEFRATKRLLTTLFEVPDLLHQALPATLSQLHDGDLGFAPHSVYANFVSSLDGVTAIDPRAPGQGGIISGGVPADRFLMGLLRAFADVVLIGAGTLRAEQEHVWSPDRVYPPAGPA
ncbi:MAG: hypothetical protein M3Z13_01575, partial [Candidatus Dormibacteraeota bacterium]|nr:hypothetical protein [Candidatus Dormibacteraeota bacterium]